MFTQKQLSVTLSKLPVFQVHAAHLEQYQLSGDLAARLLWASFLDGNIVGKTVADFGCGNGILGIGAQLLGAKEVFFVDLDSVAIALAQKNSENQGTFFCGDVVDFSEQIDTVVMNPPFGVQTRKADKVFLEHAMGLSHTIYSIHKIESGQFLEALARDHHWNVDLLFEADFPVKQSYVFHTKKVHPVRIGVWRLRKV